MEGERGLSGGAELGVFRQEDGEVWASGTGYYAAGVAVDHGDRGSPVALAGDQPVPDAVGDGAAAYTLLLHRFDHGLLAVFVGHTYELPRVDHLSRARCKPRRKSSPPQPGGAMTVLMGRSYFLA